MDHFQLPGSFISQCLKLGRLRFHAHEKDFLERTSSRWNSPRQWLSWSIDYYSVNMSAKICICFPCRLSCARQASTAGRRMGAKTRAISMLISMAGLTSMSPQYRQVIPGECICKTPPYTPFVLPCRVCMLAMWQHKCYMGIATPMYVGCSKRRVVGLLLAMRSNLPTKKKQRY